MGNVFFGNDCKIILNNYQKLRSVVLHEPEFHKHMSVSFRIYSWHDKLILGKNFLTEAEILLPKNCVQGLANSQYIFQIKLSQDA